MIYPSNTAAPSIETIFVNGVRFDLCEVCREGYNMLNDAKYRFFVVVEESHIINYEGAEKWFNATGETRWGLFCYTKADCKKYVSQFEEYGDTIKRLSVKSDSVKGEYKRTLISKANALRLKCMDIYRTYPI